MRDLLLKLVATDRKHFDTGILLLRLFIGGMMFAHGWTKLMTFHQLAAVFPDPLAIGSKASLVLVLCAEIGCSLLLIIGFMTRLATLPLMFGMLVAFFAVHATDPFAIRELPLLYFGVYVVLLWSGGGAYALDEWIRRKLILR